MKIGRSMKEAFLHLESYGIPINWPSDEEMAAIEKAREGRTVLLFDGDAPENDE